MPNESTSEIQIAFTPEFKRNVRRLSRKYRHIKSDVQPVIGQLEHGETPGDQIQRTGYTVFKIRIKNSDLQRGKSGGYRMIYYLKASDDVILVTIYSKTEQGDLTAAQIQRIIEKHKP